MVAADTRPARSAVKISDPRVDSIANEEAIKAGAY